MRVCLHIAYSIWRGSHNKQAHCLLKQRNVIVSYCVSSLSLMSRFRSSGSKHPCDDLFIVPGERAGDRSYVEPPCSTDKGHDVYGPSLSREGSERLHPEGAT